MPTVFSERDGVLKHAVLTTFDRAVPPPGFRAFQTWSHPGTLANPGYTVYGRTPRPTTLFAHTVRLKTDLFFYPRSPETSIPSPP